MGPHCTRVICPNLHARLGVALSCPHPLASPASHSDQLPKPLPWACVSAFGAPLSPSSVRPFTHSLTQPGSTCWRPCSELRTGNTTPSGPFRKLGTALLLALPWRPLSLLVSESAVRVIPSDKVSPRLQLPVSSYLHQSISTCLSILMAYGSRGESPNERKLATVLIGLKETTGGEVFFKNTHKKWRPKEMRPQ